MAHSRAICSKTKREPNAGHVFVPFNNQLQRVANATLFAFFGLLASASPIQALADTMRRETLTITSAAGKTAFSTEIAESLPDQEQGLMFRTKMGETDGMLFIYPKPLVITMWMRNTYIPLDMVFIAGDGTVRRIAAGEPLSDAIISSGEKVSAVLELKSGTASRLGLKPGDKVEAPSLHPAP